MLAAVLQDYHKITWESVDDPVLQSGTGVLVRTGCAGICGSDLHVFRGEFHPRTHVPFIQGHEFAGTVVEVGKDVTRFRPGERVVVDPIIWCGQCPACQLQHYPACSSLRLTGIDQDGGFAELAAVEEFQLYKLPDNVSSRDAALVEMFAIGFHACRRAGVQPGQNTAIWGAGRIGHSILQAVRTITAAPVFLVDVLDSRLDIAKQIYTDVICINSCRDNPLEVIRERTRGRGVDVAFEAVGHAAPAGGLPPPVVCCVRSIRGAGTVCVLGLSDQAVPLVLKELIWKEARLVASRVTHGEFSQAITQLAAGKLVPQALVSAELPGAEAVMAFRLLEEQPEQYLKIILRFGE